MNKTAKNILGALFALILIIVVIALTFSFRRQLGWWAFMDCFAAFMAVFTWLMSILISKMIPYSGKLLQKIALIFAILTVLALIAEYVIYIV